MYAFKYKFAENINRVSRERSNGDTVLCFLVVKTKLYFSSSKHSLVPRAQPLPLRGYCVGIAWKTQSETRGRAWQKMQKKVYDSTKK